MSALRLLWTLALPFVVHFCLTSNRLDELLLFLIVGALILALMFKQSPPKNAMDRLIQGFGPMLATAMTLGIALVLFAAVTKDSAKSAKLLPALSNLAFLLVFASSLFQNQPLIERFARIFHPDLSAEEVVYCRHVTWVWIAYFSLNIAAILLISAFGSLTLWTIYTGALGYVGAFALALGEYIIRKKKFGRFTATFIDRILLRMMSKGVAK